MVAFGIFSFGSRNINSSGLTQGLRIDLSDQALVSQHVRAMCATYGARTSAAWRTFFTMSRVNQQPLAGVLGIPARYGKWTR